MDEPSLPVPSSVSRAQQTQLSVPHLTDFTVTIPSSSRSSRKRTGLVEPGAGRWHTPEFRFYAAAFLIVVPIMVYIPMSLSSSNAANYQRFAHRLSPGWLFGRDIDISDPQYRSFRQNLPALLGLSAAYLVGSSAHQLCASNLWTRSTNIAVLSVVMIFVLHGLSAVKILVILGVNYLTCGPFMPAWTGRAWPLLLIVGLMGLLMLNERMDGYKMSELSADLGMWEQRWSGFLPRWHVSFNITMLRMVSFGLDRHWHTLSTDDSHSPQTHRERTTLSPPREDYGVVNYLAYCLYPPLYIAGPIMTFNDFIWQVSFTRKVARQHNDRFSSRSL